MTSAIRRSFLRVPRFALAVAIVLATVAAGVGVLSATAQEDAVIYGCVHKNSGGIRIVDDPSECKNYESPLSWSVGGTAAVVEWDDIQGVPEGIANQVAEDVVCDGCVGSADIEDFGVKTSDLDVESVQTSNLQNGSVTTEKIFQGSVTGDKLAPGAVAGGFEGPVLDGSITSDDLATNSVTSDEIFDGTIIEDDLDDQSVTNPKIADAAVNADKLADGSVAGGEGGTIADGTITGHDVQDGTITGAEIADGSVTSNDIDANYSIGNLSPASSVGPALATMVVTPIDIPFNDDGSSSSHAVMVFGDAVLTCTELGGCGGTLSWQISDGTTTYGHRTLTVRLQNGEELMVSAQQIVSLDSGTQNVSLQMSYVDQMGGELHVTPYELSVVDLGR